MKDLNRGIAFWLLSKYCGNILINLEKVDLNCRLQSVCYDYTHGGCKSRSDYVYLVECYRIFQHLDDNNWIICELLK